jgi:pyruvate kinase
MRHTKIIATIGPASAGPDVLEALMAAGVDIFRLNFSHGTHESHRVVYGRIRDVAARRARHVAILQDLSGPKIRTGPLAGGIPLQLAAGEELRISAGDEPGSRERIYTPYAPLIASARPGDRLLLDDGRIELHVTRVSPSELATVVVNGGVLAPNKGINAPGVSLPASALTAKDETDLRFGLELGVDLVALSFVQTAEDVRRALHVMTSAGRTVPVIAKIERPAAVDNLGAILEVAHGVMVARGDLGLEMPLERLPRVQKEIIRKARALGRPVIVATQVLESMRVEPRPTRAEVSDAANAVDDGVDAIMLAGETAIGAYPVRAVETLSAVISDAETVPSADRVLPAVDPTGTLHSRALCEAAVTLASTGQAHAIVAVTRHGKTARLLSSLRPPCPIVAATERTDVAGWLTMYWGVMPFVTAERDVERLDSLVVANHVAESGDVVVFINVSPDLNRADANFLNVQRLG